MSWDKITLVLGFPPSVLESSQFWSQCPCPGPDPGPVPWEEAHMSLPWKKFAGVPAPVLFASHQNRTNWHLTEVGVHVAGLDVSVLHGIHPWCCQVQMSASKEWCGLGKGASTFWHRTDLLGPSQHLLPRPPRSQMEVDSSRGTYTHVWMYYIYMCIIYILYYTHIHTNTFSIKLFHIHTWRCRRDCPWQLVCYSKISVLS